MVKTDLDTQIIVVGAGPVGLALAGELRLGGAEVIVLEQRNSRITESRASTLHARTMEIFDSRGLLEAFGELPNELVGHFGGIALDLGLPSRYPGQWKVPQTRTEELLEERALSLGADIRRGWKLLDMAKDGGSVQIVAGTPDGVRTLRAAYLVGCDGEESSVRRLTGSAFPGQPALRELLRADVTGLEIPNRRFERMERGLAIAARNKAGVTRVMVHEFGRDARSRTKKPDYQEVVTAWKLITGEDISEGKPLWVNSFGDANRLLARYRDGRVLFAGDAAHQQMPSGGQALNLGLQDAINLGWKLALQVGRYAPKDLLDTYHSERHAVGKRVLANIRAQGSLLLGGTEVDPARTLLAEMIQADHNRTYLAGMISGLDIRYPVGDGAHPLLGAFLPDTTLTTNQGSTTTTALLRGGRGLIVDFGGERTASLRWIGELWRDRVTTVTAHPNLDGPLQNTNAVLIRPDGHIAWLDVGSTEPACAALRRWFGPPTPST